MTSLLLMVLQRQWRQRASGQTTSPHRRNDLLTESWSALMRKGGREQEQSRTTQQQQQGCQFLLTSLCRNPRMTHFKTSLLAGSHPFRHRGPANHWLPILGGRGDRPLLPTERPFRPPLLAKVRPVLHCGRTEKNSHNSKNLHAAPIVACLTSFTATGHPSKSKAQNA